MRNSLHSTSVSNDNKQELVRGIGRWDLIAVVINTIIGAGIFGLPSKVFAQIGAYSLVAFGACAVIVGFIVLCHAEVASRFSRTGGAYLYAKQAFGETAGFEVGWLYWIVRMTTFATNCNLAITYLGFFWPGSSAPIARIALIGSIVAILAAVNFSGVKHTAWLTNFFTIGKLVPLILLVIVGSFFIQPTNISFGEIPGYTSFSRAVLLLIYAFVGFEVAVIPAGEIRDPQKTLPFALFTALLVVATLYILIQLVSIGTLPGLAGSERPLADAAAVSMGQFGAAFIVVGALISILGNLNVGLLGSSRILYAMSEQGELPAVVSKTHEKFRTPHISILINSIIIFVLTVQSSFLTALAMATITRLIVYATTCLSLIVFRRTEKVDSAKFKAPFGIAAASISIGLIVWLLTNVDFTTEGLPVVVAAAVGLLLYVVTRSISKKKSADAS